MEQKKQIDHQTIDFAHETPDGCVHVLKAPVTYHRSRDNEAASPIFIDGFADCTCAWKAHFVKDGIISIPHFPQKVILPTHLHIESESVNLKVRHEAGAFI